MIRRARPPGQRGHRVGARARPQLVSKGLGGAPANGPSWGAAIDGGFPEPGDKPDLPEVHRLPVRRQQPRRRRHQRRDRRVRLARPRRQARARVAAGRRVSRARRRPTSRVSIDCSHFAYVVDGQLHVRYTNDAQAVAAQAHDQARAREGARSRATSRSPCPNAADPSSRPARPTTWSSPADAGVYLIKDGVKRAEAGRPRRPQPDLQRRQVPRRRLRDRGGRPHPGRLALPRRRADQVRALVGQRLLQRADQAAASSSPRRTRAATSATATRPTRRSATRASTSRSSRTRRTSASTRSAASATSTAGPTPTSTPRCAT